MDCYLALMLAWCVAIVPMWMRLLSSQPLTTGEVVVFIAMACFPLLALVFEHVARGVVC